jgi:hypothetical protein
MGLQRQTPRSSLFPHHRHHYSHHLSIACFPKLLFQLEELITFFLLHTAMLLTNYKGFFWHGYVLHEGITYKSRVLRTSQMTSRLLRHTAAVMRAHNVLCNSYNTQPLLCARITCYVTVITVEISMIRCFCFHINNSSGIFYDLLFHNVNKYVPVPIFCLNF